MPVISPDYASPGLRQGLMLEDFPSATVAFRMAKASEFGVPEEFGGNGNVCVATITFNVEGRANVSAWKPVPAGGDADQWNVLCTKTLGRALKRAGYPDDVRDLKALVAWRKQNAQINASLGLGSGSPTQALPSGSEAVQAALPAGDPMGDALDEAASQTGRQSDDNDEPIDAEIVGEDADTLVELAGALEGREAANYRGFLTSMGAPENPHEMTAGQLRDALAWLDPDGGGD